MLIHFIKSHQKDWSKEHQVRNFSALDKNKEVECNKMDLKVHKWGLQINHINNQLKELNLKLALLRVCLGLREIRNNLRWPIKVQSILRVLKPYSSVNQIKLTWSKSINYCQDRGRLSHILWELHQVEQVPIVLVRVPALGGRQR